MLKAVRANATSPIVVNWQDPIQISNSFLTEALFNNSMADATLAVPKELLYPAVKVGIKQPDSHARCYMNDFVQNKLTKEDVQALLPDICRLVAISSEADTMWHPYPRAAGITALAKYNFKEGIALALKMQVCPEGFGWGIIRVRLRPGCLLLRGISGFVCLVRRVSGRDQMCLTLPDRGI
jgi:hypothetical protein